MTIFMRFYLSSSVVFPTRPDQPNLLSYNLQLKLEALGLYKLALGLYRFEGSILFLLNY
jgi:hypothetical protein